MSVCLYVWVPVGLCLSVDLRVETHIPTLCKLLKDLNLNYLAHKHMQYYYQFQEGHFISENFKIGDVAGPNPHKTL